MNFRLARWIISSRLDGIENDTGPSDYQDRGMVNLGALECFLHMASPMDNQIRLEWLARCSDRVIAMTPSVGP